MVMCYREEYINKKKENNRGVYNTQKRDRGNIFGVKISKKSVN